MPFYDPLAGGDRRSVYPYWYGDPGTPRKRWSAQQQFRGPFPWKEIVKEPQDDVKRERESREQWNANRRVFGDGFEWCSDGTVRATVEQPPITREQEKPQRRSEPEPIVELPLPAEADSTALHEAAHHIVAEALGCTIQQTTIEPKRNDSGGLVYGHCRYVPPKDQPLVHDLAISAAGGIADKMEYGYFINGPDSAAVERKLNEVGITDPDKRAALIAEGHELARSILVPEKTRLLVMAKTLRATMTIKPEPAVRKFTAPLLIRSGTLNAGAGDLDLVWTTGAAVRRTGYDGPYDEVLLTGAQNVRLDRLNAGAPLLNSHDTSNLSSILGSVVRGSAKMVNGQGIAQVRLSSRPEVAGFVADIRDGVIKNTSVGYRYHKVEVDTRGDIPVWNVTDWEPYEVSAVAVPADLGSQFRGGEKFEFELRG